jgi:hypothetical protein
MFDFGCQSESFMAYESVASLTQIYDLLFQVIWQFLHGVPCDAASSTGCLPLFGHVNFLVIVLHDTVEARAFFQRRAFAANNVYLRPAAMLPSSATCTATFLCPAAS